MFVLNININIKVMKLNSMLLDPDFKINPVK